MNPPRRPRFPLALERVHGDHRASAGRLLRPQRPLQQALRDATRQGMPTGLGLDSAAVRLRMVERLRADGLRQDAVLAALSAVERHRFVDTALANQAYEDTSLPIGHGQTISKPSVVARMLALLFEGRSAAAQGSLGCVLEVGTGCGYQAALLLRLARRVLSIERLEALHRTAQERLSTCRGDALRLVHGDGRVGHPPWAPYDSIIAAAGGDALPPAWLEQLAIGGRLVAPVHDKDSGGQTLVVVDRDEAGWRTRRCDAVHFVPLESGRR